MNFQTQTRGQRQKLYIFGLGSTYIDKLESMTWIGNQAIQDAIIIWARDNAHLQRINRAIEKWIDGALENTWANGYEFSKFVKNVE
jgi:hypothetical protein